MINTAPSVQATQGNVLGLRVVGDGFPVASLEHALEMLPVLLVKARERLPKGLFFEVHGLKIYSPPWIEKRLCYYWSDKIIKPKKSLINKVQRKPHHKTGFFYFGTFST
jgi:hypothetical protein